MTGGVMGGLFEVLMGFIGSFFVRWGQWLMESIVPTVLANLGLGLTYFTGFHAILTWVTNESALSNITNPVILDFMGLTGIDNVISMLVSAFGVRVSMLAIKRVFFTAGGAA